MDRLEKVITNDSKDEIEKCIKMINLKRDELMKHEKDKYKLPEYFKNWFMAQDDIKNLSQRPYEYVHTVNKARMEMLKILNNKLYFCLGGDHNNTAKQL